MSILSKRLRKELASLERDPPPGIVCYPVNDNITQLESYMNGPPDSPYQQGLFQLDITIPSQYPFDPPQIRFRTPIYHPNIDDNGRICADILKKSGKGGWKPSLNIATTLMALSMLLAYPNPDDPLDADIAREFITDHDTFCQKAKAHTEKHATGRKEESNVAINNDPSTTNRAVSTNTDMTQTSPAESLCGESETAVPLVSKTPRLSLSKKKQAKPKIPSAATQSSIETKDPSYSLDSPSDQSPRETQNDESTASQLAKEYPSHSESTRDQLILTDSSRQVGFSENTQESVPVYEIEDTEEEPLPQSLPTKQKTRPKLSLSKSKRQKTSNT